MRSNPRSHSCKRKILLHVVAVLFLLGCGADAFAQTRERLVLDPPVALRQILRVPIAPSARVTTESLATPAQPGAGEARFEFDILSTSATIYNPATDRDEKVELRSYRDVRETAPPRVPFVAPTIDVFPGDTVRITLNNKLKSDPACVNPGNNVNEPNCYSFNRTNLHAHGVWISPTGNSDNVLISINPSVSFQYEYNIPADHPAGTFWYHPHLHGSTALQVSSGMAGVLIIRGARMPTVDATGDIDTLLKGADGTPYRDRIVLLQQIPYACRDASGAIKTQKDAGGNVIAWVCDLGDTGEVRDYDQFGPSGPSSWKASGRYTSINGEVLPEFPDAQVGRLERWRVVHAGVRDTVKLQFKKMRDGAESYAKVDSLQQEDWLSRNCPGETLLPQFGFASDGLTRSRVVERVTTTLQPGYREDLLLVFPESGRYCILDGEAAAVSTVNNQTKSRRFLGTVAVSGAASVADVRGHVRSELVSAADRNMPISVRQKVHDDLVNGLRLTAFAGHGAIADNEISPPLREATFQIGAGVFMINGKPYDPTRIDQTLPLGAVEEWKLSTVNAFGHPFHIHVNPFQISRIIKDSTNQDVSETDDPDEPQYANLKGVWKDTLFVRQGYTAYVRTRYRRYVGDFVLHCHILDHEDKGMMQNIRIAVPDGKGGTVSGHH